MVMKPLIDDTARTQPARGREHTVKPGRTTDELICKQAAHRHDLDLLAGPLWIRHRPKTGGLHEHLNAVWEAIRSENQPEGP